MTGRQATNETKDVPPAYARFCFIGVILFFAFGCTTPPMHVTIAPSTDVIQRWLTARPDQFAAITTGEAAAEHRVQILVSEIVDDDGRPTLRRHGYRLGAEYFYPASTVKLCGSVAALMRLHELQRDTDLPLTVHMPMVIHPLFEGQTIKEHDATNLDGGRFTVAHEIRKIFLVSSNSAYNHLFEFAGQREINELMWALGLRSVRLVHRLSEHRTREENLRSPRIDFLLPDGRVHTIPPRTSDLRLDNTGVPRLDIARGYMEGDRLVQGPMSFLYKNHISIIDLQDLMIKIIRPEIDLGTPPLSLEPADLALLMEAMAQHPYDSPNPRYTQADIPPQDAESYLAAGLRRITPGSSEDWLIYDKQGQAYGFTTENAAIVHRPTGRTFFITATIYTNPDGVLNDDRYDYPAARRFYADLAEMVARELMPPW